MLTSPQEMADYWAKRPNYDWFGRFGEEWSRKRFNASTICMVRAAPRSGSCAVYLPMLSRVDPLGAVRWRWHVALDSWDTKEVVSAFHEAIGN